MNPLRQLLLVAALAFVAYANSFRAGFVFDNRAIILEDPRLQAATTDNLRLIFTKEYWWPREGQALYRPLTTLSYWFNYAVLGNKENPVGYHVVNFLLHLASIALVFALARHLARDNITSATCAAAVFAVHPVTTEAVANLVGRADQLATLFVLVGLLAHIRKRPVLTGVAWFLGLLSKENAIVLPGLLVLHDLLFRDVRVEWKRLLPSYSTLLVAAGVWWALRQQAFAHTAILPFTYLDNALLAGDRWSALLTAITILGRYLLLLVWPQHLTADYSFNQIPLVHSLGDPILLCSLIAVVTALVLAARWVPRRPAFTFLVAAFFTALLPTANLFFLCGSTMAERFLYLPSVWFAIGAALALAQLHRHSTRQYAIITGTLLLALAARTALRNLDWHDDATFWERLTETSPRSFRAQAGYARTLFAQDSDPTKAAPYLQQALAIAPDALPLLIQAGEFYRQTGQLEDSRTLLLRAQTAAHALTTTNRLWVQQHHGQPELVTDFPSAAVATELGQTYQQLQQYDAAIESFLTFRRIKPTDATGYLLLADAYRTAGQRAEAIRAYWQHTFISADRQSSFAALLPLYATEPKPNCALLTEQGSTRLNVHCPLVQTHICAAHAELAELLAAAGFAGEAATARERAAQVFGCAPDRTGLSSAP